MKGSNIIRRNFLSRTPSSLIVDREIFGVFRPKFPYLLHIVTDITEWCLLIKMKFLAPLGWEAHFLVLLCIVKLYKSGLID